MLLKFDEMEASTGLRPKFVFWMHKIVFLYSLLYSLLRWYVSLIVICLARPIPISFRYVLTTNRILLAVRILSFIDSLTLYIGDCRGVDIAFKKEKCRIIVCYNM